MQLLSWLCLLSSPVASEFSNSLVMLQLIARLVWAVLGMHSVFLLLALISRTALLLGVNLGRLTKSETLFLLRNRIKQTFFHRFRHKGE